ncbi:MAG TPA: acyl-CoA reductase [Polyangiaceae bacterium]|nr:acyl-CoA reductase [Polyangiaceae bacterium]
MSPAARARLERLLEAARGIRDPETPLGREARARLSVSTGLSAAGIELAISKCLETHPTEAELERLAASVESAPRAHVLLSANVFTAAHRAIALALAASEQVFVRPSRREPEMARLLLRGAPGLFTLVDPLEPEPGDALFAYGSDVTLNELRAALAPGVRLHGHGSGFGILAADAQAVADRARREELAQAIALDVALFDQRGCLSPRGLLLEGNAELAHALLDALARSFAELEARVPVGALAPEERAEQRRQRAALAFAGTALAAGSGFVAIVPEARALASLPVGRCFGLVCTENATEAARALAPAITTYGVAGSPELRARFANALPHARASAPGRLQCPPLDGPADPRPKASRSAA